MLARGVAASPGAAKGEIVFTAADAVAAGADGRDVVLVRPFTEADDVAGFHAAKGILTSEGGKASHAALVARGMGVPAVTGADGLEIDVQGGQLRVGDTTLEAGDRIAIDGTTGCITTADVPLVEPEVDERFEDGAALERRAARAWACAPTPTRPRTPAVRASSAPRASGCAAPSTCSSAAERHEKMVRVILADDEQERRASLDALLPLQQGDFEGLFEEMEGLPVTIRLLDPPLHEFLPDRADIQAEVERARIERTDDLADLERTLERVRALEEVNPMLGTRGCGSGILLPRDLRDAGRGDHARRQGRARAAGRDARTSRS